MQVTVAIAAGPCDPEPSERLPPRDDEEVTDPSECQSDEEFERWACRTPPEELQHASASELKEGSGRMTAPAMQLRAVRCCIAGAVGMVARRSYRVRRSGRAPGGALTWRWPSLPPADPFHSRWPPRRRWRRLCGR